MSETFEVVATGAAADAVAHQVPTLVEDRFASGLFAKDPTLWGPEAASRKPNLKRALRLMRLWRDAGVPLGCRTGDSRRRELLSMPRCRPRETGSGLNALAFDGSVDRRAAHAEELGDFEGAVLAAVH